MKTKIHLDAVTIRSLRRADLPTIHALMVRTFRENPAYLSHSELQRGIFPGRPVDETAEAYLMEHCRMHVGRPSFAGLVAEIRGRVMGFVLIRRHAPKGAPAYGELSDVVLTPGKKSSGIGQMLLARAVAQFREWGCGQVFLETGAMNKAAHRFFVGQGWKVVSHVLRLPTSLAAAPGIEMPDGPPAAGGGAPLEASG